MLAVIISTHRNPNHDSLTQYTLQPLQLENVPLAKLYFILPCFEQNGCLKSEIIPAFEDCIESSKT